MVQHFLREVRIEPLVHLHVGGKGNVGQFKLFGHHEDVLQHLGSAILCRNAIHENGTLLLAEQSADEVEQGALACTVLTEQAINVVLLEFQREITSVRIKSQKR